MDNVVTTLSETGTIAGRGTVTVDEKGLKAPDNIILTVEAARTYYTNYRLSHGKRVSKYASIMGLISGNSPYDKAQLKAAGLSHVTNVNTLDAKAKYEKAGLTFWNLINQTENLVRFEISNLGVDQDRDYAKWAQIMARNFTKVIQEEWPDFTSVMNIATGQLVMLGHSPVVWPDEEDFRWESVECARFYIPDQMSVLRNKWSVICFETLYDIQYLYGVYQAIKDSTDTQGWNKQALENFILFRANAVNKSLNANATSNLGTMVDLQNRISNGDFNLGALFSDQLNLVHMLYKEYSGKISHYTFDPVPNTTNDFLYKRSEAYEKFDDVMTVLTFSPEERTIHGNKGVGHSIFPICQAMTQLDCTMIDMSKMGSTLLVKTPPGGVAQKAGPIRFIPGVATDVGSMDIVQNQLNSNIDKVVTIARYMEAKIDKNSIINGDDPSVPDTDRGSKSTAEVQMASLKEFGIGKNSVSHFYSQVDNVYKNMVIKLLNATNNTNPSFRAADRWKKRCMMEGVPPQVFDKNQNEHLLPEHLAVRASRAAGDGSTAGFIVSLNRIGSVAGGFGQQGQQNYRRDIIAANLGNDYAERYLSDLMTPDEAAGGTSLAALENIVMKMGESPIVSRDNQHKSHIGTHAAMLMETIQKVQAQEMEPQEADAIFARGIDHWEQHIKILAEDELNQGYIEQMQGSIRQIKKFAQLNRVRAQKMMQAEVRRRGEEEQAMQAAEMEQQRKDMVTQREEERKDFKVKAQVQRAAEASTTRAEVMKRDVDKRAENQRRDIELRNQNERAKIRKPQEILADQTTEEIQSTLMNQVGNTANPADFE